MKVSVSFCMTGFSGLSVPSETPVRIVKELTRHGYNAERDAVTLLANTPDPTAAVATVIEHAPADTLTLTADLVRETLPQPRPVPDPTAVTGHPTNPGSGTGPATHRDGTASATPAGPPGRPAQSGVTRARESAVTVANDVTGQSTGTGTYDDFVRVFRDRYERLAQLLRSRVTHRPANTLPDLAGGSEAAMIGMINDLRTTRNGHTLIELEDPTGTFPCLVSKDRDLAAATDELLLDEVIAVTGRLSDDTGVLFADAIHHPDIPRTHQPATADRPVKAALISDVHVGSQEFLADAWNRFATWLHTPEAHDVEYLVIAGDMVEGVGVYPGQDDELDIIDIYDQYETFNEHLKALPDYLELILIPGNHDAVRLAEPQPAFTDDLCDIMTAHDPVVTGNPSTVTIEGVTILLYHGVSLDEVIAELPAATYDHPAQAMSYLLRKRHLAPQFGGQTRLAPEERDYLVIEDIPDIFHAGHVHKLDTGRYHNVTIVNSGCWQAQTAFQRRVNITPDAGYAPIIDLSTHDITIRKFT